MSPPRSRRVQAQRKFAQGAYVPPNVVGAVAVANENRREAVQDARNVTINHMSPTDLLNVVSMQGIHTHLQPVVLIETLRGKSSSDAALQTTQHRNKEDSVIKHRTLPLKPLNIRKKKDYKRNHGMSLRSRRLCQLEFKKIEAASRTTTRQAAAKRKVPIEPEKMLKSKKKHIVAQKDRRLESSEFSLDDNRPLMYFAKCSTPKAPAPATRATQPFATLPEPVAGPSGMQKITTEVPPVRSGNIISSRGSYYNSEHNIHRWMNDSLTPESRRSDEVEGSKTTDFNKTSPLPCLAKKWRSVQDVNKASKKELESRCNKCKPCLRICKLMKLSSLLKTQVNLDLMGTEPLPQKSITQTENDARGSPEADHGHLYLDLLPKHPNVMMKLRIHMVLGKQLLSACLVPRCDALINKQEFLLNEQEHLLDQLIETLMLSLNDKTRDGRVSSHQTETSSFSLRYTPPDSHIASEMQARIREKEAMVSRIEAEKAAEVSRIEAEKQAEVSRINAEKIAEVSRLEAQKAVELSRLEAELRTRLRAELEAEVRMQVEVDQQAKALDAEKDAKGTDKKKGDGSADDDEEVSGNLFEAPVFRPTAQEFNDPITYFEKIWSEAIKFGICKIIPPPDWKPTSKIMDDLRFTVTNQYISRLFSRWGPAARELCAIKLCLQHQKIQFNRAPLLDGIEVNLSKLYRVVQRNGGLETVINKKRWGKVAEEMKFNRTPTTERKLDQIYVKYLLSFVTLGDQRQEIMRKVERAWNKKNQKLLDRSLNPLHHQKRMLGLSDSSDDDSEEEDLAVALSEAEDCIISGASMNLAKFKKIASNTYDLMFGQRPVSAGPPTEKEIEEEYWNHVVYGTEHFCVHTANIDTGDEGHGFTRNKNEPYGRHPWNLKMFSQNPRNVLRYLGPVLGVTVPTLHLGMLFSTSCWHKDPHVLPWLEFAHNEPVRIWYGIPSEQTDNFRKAVETICPTFCQNKGLWLSSDIAMIPPHILRKHNVSLTRTAQEKGEFVMAFPNAYTCSISTGYTESESVYFAPPSWLENLPDVFMAARESCEPTMFSMERFLYLMGKDQRLDQSLLKVVQPIYDKMLRDEVNNRQMLQERGLKFIHETASSARRKRRNETWNIRLQEECEYCRTSLFLSKVKGLTSKKSSLCLEHTLKLLDTDRYKNKNVAQLEVHVYVTVRELNAVGDDMKRRLGSSTS